MADNSKVVQPAPKAKVIYREWLYVPVFIWIFAIFMVASLAFVLLVVLEPIPLLIASCAVLVLVLAGLASYGTSIVVTKDYLKAGRAHIPTEYIGQVQALTEAETQRYMRADYHPKAYYLTRPGPKEAVLFTVTDPADPTPFWFISSRNPALLVAAIKQSQKSD